MEKQIKTKNGRTEKGSRKVVTHVWLNTCSLFLTYSTSLSRRHTQSWNKRSRSSDVALMILKQNSPEWRSGSPWRPDGFIVQNADLMHPAAAVQAFDKPENQNAQSRNKTSIVSSKMELQRRSSLTVQGPECRSSSSQTGPCLSI